jgi:hypothetical protein
MERQIDVLSMSLLMILCSSTGDSVSALWKHFWRNATCYEDLPNACKPLLPWVAAKLELFRIPYDSAHLPSDLTPAQLLGKRRHAWASKAINRQKAFQWSSILSSAGIDHCFIKGIACTAYNPLAQLGRPASDVDLFVDQTNWSHALKLLISLNDFLSCQSPTAQTLGGRTVEIHAISLEGKSCDLDLHRHPIPGFMHELQPFIFTRNFQFVDGLPLPSLADHLAICTLHAFAPSNLRDHSYLKYLADVLPSLGQLSAEDFVTYSRQVSCHESDTNALEQVLLLDAQVRANFRSSGLD